MIPRQRSTAAAAAASPSPGVTLAEPPVLQVSVSDPVKLGNGVQAYVSYRVATKTNVPEYRGPEKIVIRRYSDFAWLHERLAAENKGIFIPPLPEKNAVEKFRFSAEFIEIRRKALLVFVNRVASHPHLRQSEDLRNFLQADEEDWALERVKSQGGAFTRKPSDFMQFFKEVQVKVSDVILGKEKPVGEADPDYEKLKHYVSELEEHLGEAQKQSLRLVKRHKELGQTLWDFGKAVKALGACEGANLGRAFAEFGSQSELLSYKLQKQAQDILLNFEEPLKEYVLTVQSIKNTMADRAQAFKQQQELMEATKLKEINLEKMKLVRPDKAFEADFDFKESKIRSELACKHFETIVRLMQQELTRFQEQKMHDLGLIFLEFARAQAQLAHDTADAWRSLIPKLERRSLCDIVLS